MLPRHRSPPLTPHSRLSKSGSLDAIGIALSIVCLVHCLALPILLAALPLTAAATVADERFHFWMLLAVVPVSGLALGFATVKRKSYGLAAFGTAGVALIGIAALGRLSLGISETGDRWLTTAGVLMLASSHLLNFRQTHVGHSHFGRRRLTATFADRNEGGRHNARDSCSTAVKEGE